MNKARELPRCSGRTYLSLYEGGRPCPVAARYMGVDGRPYCRKHLHQATPLQAEPDLVLPPRDQWVGEVVDYNRGARTITLHCDGRTMVISANTRSLFDALDAWSKR